VAKDRTPVAITLGSDSWPYRFRVVCKPSWSTEHGDGVLSILAISMDCRGR